MPLAFTYEGRRIDAVEHKDSSLPSAWRLARAHAAKEGFVVSLPQYFSALAGMRTVYACTTITAESIVPDTEGFYGKRGKSVVIISHKGSPLTPERVEDAYRQRGGLVSNSITLTPEEATALLKEKDIDVLPFAEAKKSKSGYHSPSEAKANPLFVKRVGGEEAIDRYFDSILNHSAYQGSKRENLRVGNLHHFGSVDLARPQSSLLGVHVRGGIQPRNMRGEAHFLTVQTRSAKEQAQQTTV